MSALGRKESNFKGFELGSSLVNLKNTKKTSLWDWIIVKSGMY